MAPRFTSGKRRSKANLPRRLLHGIATLLLTACTVILSLDAARKVYSAEERSVPNIVLILADDLGFSDLGCYGSEIPTPNLDKLANGGLRFTQFYNNGRCCPSRASLMTGLYPHQTGVGHMMTDFRKPGYKGNLAIESATLAELLRAAGYQTYMAGKWHLTRHIAPEGPKFDWPQQRGFDRFYGTIDGAGSYFDPGTLTRDNQFLRESDRNYYYTDAISQRAAEYLEAASRVKKPFFLYVAYTAPHWPLHAPPESISRFRGRYAGGWDAIRKARYQKMLALGIIKAEWPMTPRDERVRNWEQNSYKEWQQRRMEVYAAQVEQMDRGIGRILDKIRQVGAERNTLVMFLSDNGGCAEEITPQWTGSFLPAKTRDGRMVQVGNDPNIMPGPEITYQSYGLAWANVSNTPFRLYKHWVHEGGIATPLIVYWPAAIKQGGTLVHGVGHVIDIVPTCLAAAKFAHPKQLGGYSLLRPEGESLLPVIQGGPASRRRALCWEHEGNRAVRDGKWKLVAPYAGPWELYDMEADRTELKNLAAQFPVVVKEMSQTYDAWAKRCHVEPWRQ